MGSWRTTDASTQGSSSAAISSGDPLPQQCNMTAWASPLHFRVHVAYRTGTKRRAVLQREDEQRQSSGPSKGLCAVAALRCQTFRGSADSGLEHEDSLWDWLTTSTTTKAATQTSAPEALQQWCSIQHEYWMELQRRTQRTLETRAGSYRRALRQQSLSTGSNQGHRSRHERPQPVLQRGFESAAGASQTCRLPTSSNSSENADKALGAEAASQASERKEEI